MKSKELNIQDENGKTQLIQATWSSDLIYAAYYGHTDIVKYLLTKGANKDLVAKKGETALSIAQKKQFDLIASVLTG